MASYRVDTQPATGLGAWAQDAGTDYGPNTVTEGSSAAYFNVYDFSSGTVGSMTTPSVDLTSANNPSLNLDYWNSSGSDRVVISVTTDGTNFTNIDTLLFIHLGQLSPLIFLHILERIQCP